MQINPFNLVFLKKRQTNIFSSVALWIATNLLCWIDHVRGSLVRVFLSHSTDLPSVHFNQESEVITTKKKKDNFGGCFKNLEENTNFFNFFFNNAL